MLRINLPGEFSYVRYMNSKLKRRKHIIRLGGWGFGDTIFHVIVMNDSHGLQAVFLISDDK